VASFCIFAPPWTFVTILAPERSLSSAFSSIVRTQKDYLSYGGWPQPVRTGRGPWRERKSGSKAGQYRFYHRKVAFTKEMILSLTSQHLSGQQPVTNLPDSLLMAGGPDRLWPTPWRRTTRSRRESGALAKRRFPSRALSKSRWL